MNIEDEIKVNGLNAPRVTPADIEAEIESEHYFTAKHGVIGAAWCSTENQELESLIYRSGRIPDALKLLTFCVFVLRNGFTVTGESACASPNNADTGRKLARQKAIEKIEKMWPLAAACATS